MHIPDGFLSAPVYVAGFAVSGAVCAVAVARANRRLGEREVPLLGMTAAFIFAAQMLNFPVAGGTSGHFLGATLAAVLLGPLNACLVMAIVLLIQCLGFADGGLTTLGANLFNMGIVGAVGGWLLFRALRAILPRSRRGFLSRGGCGVLDCGRRRLGVLRRRVGLVGDSPLRVALPCDGRSPRAHRHRRGADHDGRALVGPGGAAGPGCSMGSAQRRRRCRRRSHDAEGLGIRPGWAARQYPVGSVRFAVRFESAGRIGEARPGKGIRGKRAKPARRGESP